MEKVDIAIIGAGVIGLAAAHALSKLKKEIVVLEKHPAFGQEASSRNSEVIHSGIYYPKESLKAKTCIRGKELLYDLCRKRGIPHKRLGKLVVACDNEGALKLDNIYKNALACGIKDLRFLDKKEIKKIEPHVSAEKALFVPDTGIIETHALMKSLFGAAKENGADFCFSVKVIGIKKEGSFYEITVKEPRGDFFSFKAKAVINCAGLWADEICELAGIDPEKSSYRIHYCKGRYFRIRKPEKFQIRHLVYPPPTETDLGIHLTPDLAGGLRLGPDTEYVKEINYDVDEGKKMAFLSSVAKFLPSLEESDLIADTAGIRAKLQARGEPFRDFMIKNEEEKGFPNLINVIGIESPGLTGCLAIGERISSCLSIQ